MTRYYNIIEWIFCLVESWNSILLWVLQPNMLIHNVYSCIYHTLVLPVVASCCIYHGINDTHQGHSCTASVPASSYYFSTSYVCNTQWATAMSRQPMPHSGILPAVRWAVFHFECSDDFHVWHTQYECRECIHHH